MDIPNLPGSIFKDRELYSDFLPKFRALIELENWSQDLEKSMELIRATKKMYEKIHKEESEPFHDSLRNLHEEWWLQGSPGEVRVYRVITQYLKPATYGLTVACDNDEGKQYFSRTAVIYNSSQNLEDIARALIREVITEFKSD